MRGWVGYRVKPLRLVQAPYWAEATPPVRLVFGWAASPGTSPLLGRSYTKAGLVAGAFGWAARPKLLPGYTKKARSMAGLGWLRSAAESLGPNDRAGGFY